MNSPDHRSLLHRLFEQQARKTPEGVALHEGKQSITYGELDARAEDVASSLRAQGIQNGCVVGLHLERSIDWVAGILGILKANAAVVPLPPSFPAGRLREILDYAALDLVIDGAVVPLDRSLTRRVICWTELSSHSAERNEAAPEAPDQPAFVLCSSGSTGAPKMIVRSHRSFLHRLRWTWRQHPYSRGEVCCQKAHSTTTHAVYELFEPLLCGVPVVIIPDSDVRDLEIFWDTIRTRGISRLLIVPSALHSSLEMPGFSGPPLNVVVLMGEYVSPGLARRALNTFPPQTRLYSIYGSTEASSTLVCDLRASLRAGEELPLGKPISQDVRAVVLGPGLEPVAPGEVGRLYMAGSALFTEYFRNPALTESVFVHRSGHFEPMYDTHDKVRYLPDGNFQFIGRVDDVVKIRGFRVDLQEVERAILTSPGVRQAAVAVCGTESGNPILFAFVSPATVHQAEVYETLRDRLPAYMVPSKLVGLDTFPITARGKIDRVRLLKEHADRKTSAKHCRTTSDTERRVCEVWKQTLGHDVFELDSSYFEVGGTSLTVFALVHSLRAAFALDRSRLPEQSVYRFPTVAELAAYIEGIESGQTQQVAPTTPLLVTLRRGSDVRQPPLFLIASAGGTLGAYGKLTSALRTSREIIGVRDPFIWGERDPTEGFQRWIGRYLEAIRERQPQGPYYIGAYSSAGAFGYEIARQLRQDGQTVALLALIDTLAFDRRSRWRYGWWALRATYARPSIRTLVRLAGWLRTPLVLLRWTIHPNETPNDHGLTTELYRQVADGAMRNREHLLALAALLELNTGLPFSLNEADFLEASSEHYLGILQARVTSLTPTVDPETIKRIAVQYAIQVRAQNAYELRRYNGPAVLIEPATGYAGLLKSMLRPYVKHLQVRTIKLGEPSPQTLSATKQFGALAAHYRSMRDDLFVQGLANELDRLLV